MCRLWQWNGVVLRSPSAAIVVGCHWYALFFVHQLCTLLSSQSDFGRSQVIGKADTIHSAQGVTVGRGQALKHVLLKWSREWEVKTPGLFYTGASRAKDITAMALAGPLSVRDAQSIGLSPPIASAL